MTASAPTPPPRITSARFPATVERQPPRQIVRTGDAGLPLTTRPTGARFSNQTGGRACFPNGLCLQTCGAQFNTRTAGNIRFFSNAGAAQKILGRGMTVKTIAAPGRFCAGTVVEYNTPGGQQFKLTTKYGAPEGPEIPGKIDQNPCGRASDSRAAR